MPNGKQLTGFIMAVSAGVLWGISDSCGQYAFMHYDFSAKWLTVIRMIAAGGILCCFNAVKRKEDFKRIWQNRRSALQLAAFAVFGLMLSQFTTFEAIKQSNAGTATVLQSLSPVILLLWTCVTMWKLPHKYEAAALILAFFGVFVLSTHGKISTMVLSPAGLFWGLMSAVTAASYTLLSAGLAKRYDPIVVTGYGLLIGGIVFVCVNRIWTVPLHLGPDGWLAVGGTVFLGTLFTYSLYVGGCAIVGPVKGALLALMEPVVATLLSVVWLRSGFELIDLGGILLIFAAVVLLTKIRQADAG